ncbi:MAG: archease [Candidatus Bathyarchaeota archaeon]|jgi:SHS2 domain-containing protein|nr:archease [Candidatus Bathyarchaeota archaeon]
MILKPKDHIIHLAEAMRAKKRFEFLEHTADAYIAAYGKDLAEAFENAALALFEVMTDVEKVNPQIEDYVEVSAEDEYALLYSWLEALLIKFETNGILYSKFKILELDKTPSGFQLKAKIWGEKYNPQKHPQKVGVKAVTYHRMKIIKTPNKTTLRFILDI